MKKTITPQKNTQFKDYADLLCVLKDKIQKAQIKAALSVNQKLIVLYLEIGKAILEKQKISSWGKSVVEQLSIDLQKEFPNMKGFSSRNLWDMRRFYEAYKGDIKLRQLAAEIPWGHNLVILNSIKNQNERAWYIKSIIENGWSRNVLIHWIESGLYKRQGKAITNFKRNLPKPQSDLANQIIKDPYNFDFLTIQKDAQELDIEKNLIIHIKDFLLELGVGFAYVGNQYHLDVGGEDFYLDLLFYHTKLHCYIVIDLKMTEFKAEYSGKMNFYLTAVDKIIKAPEDAPSIGLILCKTKNKLVVEYALQDIHKPVGVSSYTIKLLESLPKQLEGKLPSTEQLEKEFGKAVKKERP